MCLTPDVAERTVLPEEPAKKKKQTRISSESGSYSRLFNASMLLSSMDGSIDLI